MPFQLTAKQQKERAALASELSVAWDAVSTALETAKEEISVAIDALNSHIATYNEIRDRAQDWIETTRSDWRSAFDEKSETWQQGDRGSEVDGLISEWENLDLEAVDQVEDVDLDLSGDGSEHVQELEGLPEGV